MCAPSEKFLNMGGPLAIGLGVVFVSSLGRCYNPKNMNCISIYMLLLLVCIEVLVNVLKSNTRFRFDDFRKKFSGVQKKLKLNNSKY